MANRVKDIIYRLGQKRLARLKSGRLALLERLYGLAIENILKFIPNGRIDEAA